MEAGVQPQWPPFRHCHLLSEPESLIGPELTKEAGLSGLPSPPPRAGMKPTVAQSYAQLFTWFGGFNSGPHTCVAIYPLTPGPWLLSGALP